MYADQAERLIELISYKPRWKLDTRASGPQTVELAVDYWADNSNTEYYPTFTAPVNNMMFFTLDLKDIISPLELIRLVRNCLLQCEIHELDEFIKIDMHGVRQSPFHPHQEEGNTHLRMTERVATPLPA